MFALKFDIESFFRIVSITFLIFQYTFFARLLFANLLFDQSSNRHLIRFRLAG